MACIRILVSCACTRLMPVLKHSASNKEYKNMWLCQMQMIKALRQKRFYCYKPPGGLNFEGVTKFLRQRASIIIIDVRDRYEVMNTGQIPGSINLPIRELDYALEYLDDEQFKKQYGACKPTKSDAILFYCKDTHRGREAASRAKALGYYNVNFYAGGYSDWLSHH